jgi:RNA 3'-terminal phosphate cyclase-like protein
MGKTTYRRLQGSQNLRQRLLLATLSACPVLIEEIRADETLPGLRPYEVSLLRLFEMVSDDCVVEINETGNFFLLPP